MKKNNTQNRRGFLKASALVAGEATGILFLPSRVLGGEGGPPPSEKLSIAGIGVGGMGFSNLRNMESENIVALCDVDLGYAAKAFQRHPKAKVYTDYRVLLDKQKDLDAVFIATPDHTHAVIANAAMKAGKHVYCQKPLTHDVYEARVLANTAADTGVVTQMGNQHHSSEGIRLVCEWIWDGALGAVREVDAWCSLKYRPFGHRSWSTLTDHRPNETPPVPETLEWDTWIGPAPYRPYHPTYHPRRWRAWWDFGCGMMGDRGAHTLDSVYWALKLAAPTRVELLHKEGDNTEIHPDVAVVRYQFPARGELPPVTVNWYEGREPPRPVGLEEGRRLGDSEGGAIFKGDRGALMHGTYPGSPCLVPKAAMDAYQRPPKSLPRVAGSHERNWIDCCKTGQRACSDFAYAGPLTEFCLLGNLAIRLGGKIEWDAERMQAVGRPEADEWIRRPRRPGWEL